MSKSDIGSSAKTDDTENEIKGTKISAEMCSCSMYHFDDILRNLSDLKNSSKFCDFVIKIGDEVIPVHRVVLAASSLYFDAMFSHNMKEKNDGVLKIEGVDLEAAKICINFIYTGTADFSDSFEFAENLIYASELFQLRDLTIMFCNFMTENVCVENCLRCIEITKRYSLKAFIPFFRRYFELNFSEVVNCSKELVEVNEGFLYDLLSEKKTILCIHEICVLPFWIFPYRSLAAAWRCATTIGFNSVPFFSLLNFPAFARVKIFHSQSSVDII